ncbi:hypothetical protein BHM03_00015690 [Ensete ventricosum]|nr:hypothetical protein BHM03_00015690 [Ensete ventricosum]
MLMILLQIEKGQSHYSDCGICRLAIACIVFGACRELVGSSPKVIGRLPKVIRSLSGVRQELIEGSRELIKVGMLRMTLISNWYAKKFKHWLLKIEETEMPEDYRSRNVSVICISCTGVLSTCWSSLIAILIIATFLVQFNQI